MKQFIFTYKERVEDKKEIIKFIGLDTYEKLVIRKWEIRNIERGNNHDRILL
jgi:hypothetical protein